jgi:hypothetical protein
VLEFLTQQQFLHALAAFVGPLAVFAAPTEEIERMLFGVETAEDHFLAETPTNLVPQDLGIADAA